MYLEGLNLQWLTFRVSGWETAPDWYPYGITPTTGVFDDIDVLGGEFGRSLGALGSLGTFRALGAFGSFRSF
jgi:hypothetical protein